MLGFVKMTLRIAAAALLAVLTPSLAVALPGQSVAAFTPWAKSNTALHGLARMTNQMTGSPYYHATFHAGGLAGAFTADVDDRERISDEIVGLETSNESYDILKHLDTAAQLLAAVYGLTVPADFTGSSKVGTWTMYGERSATAIYRGKIYAYELRQSYVKLIPLASIDAEVKSVEGCVHQECGD